MPVKGVPAIQIPITGGSARSMQMSNIRDQPASQEAATQQIEEP
jgi:hypothetical protein